MANLHVGQERRSKVRVSFISGSTFLFFVAVSHLPFQLGAMFGSPFSAPLLSAAWTLAHPHTHPHCNTVHDRGFDVLDFYSIKKVWFSSKNYTNFNYKKFHGFQSGFDNVLFEIKSIFWWLGIVMKCGCVHPHPPTYIKANRRLTLFSAPPRLGGLRS